MTAEEAIIRLGFDMTAMQKGFAGMDFFVKNSVQKTLTALKSLVAVNMVEIGMKVAEIWGEVATIAGKGFWENFYGVQGGAELEKHRLKLRDIFQERASAEEAHEARSDQFYFKRLSDEEKFNYLLKKRADLDGKLDDIAFKRAKTKFGLDPQAVHRAQAELDAQSLRIKTKQLEITDQLEDLEEKIKSHKQGQAQAAGDAAAADEKRMNQLVKEIGKSGNADAIQQADDLVNPKVVDENAPKNWDYLRGVSTARANYLRGIAERTKNPALAKQFGDMADDLTNPKKVTGDNAENLNKMLRELNTLMVKMAKDGIVIIPHE